MVAFVRRTASSASATGLTTSTGPNVSSVTAVLSSGTSASTTGSTNGGRTEFASPTTARPPRSSASVMWRSTTSGWAGVVIGPYGASGSAPGRTCRTSSASLARNGSYTGLLDVDALDSGARLPGVAQAAEDRRLGGGVEVGVGGDDERVLAAALDHHRGQALGAGGHDRAPVAADPVNAILSTPARHSAAPVVPSPVTTCSTGWSGAARPALGQPHADARGELAGLEHHRVAGGERVRYRAHRRVDRVVPRPDHADHAVRHVLDGAGLVEREQAGGAPTAAAAPAGRAGPPSPGARRRASPRAGHRRGTCRSRSG